MKGVSLGWVLMNIALFTHKASERVINYYPNDQKWQSQVLLSRHNLLEFALIWTCDPTIVRFISGDSVQ